MSTSLYKATFLLQHESVEPGDMQTLTEREILVFIKDARVFRGLWLHPHATVEAFSALDWCVCPA